MRSAVSDFGTACPGDSGTGIYTLDWVGARRKGEYFVTLPTRRYFDPCCVDLGVFRPLVSLFS